MRLQKAWVKKNNLIVKDKMKTIPALILCLKDILCKKPVVIVDFIFDQGLLYIAVKNIGAQPAFKVSTQFDKEIVEVFLKIIKGHEVGLARTTTMSPVFIGRT